MPITYQNHLSNVDWDEVKAKVKEDDFDNGRTPEQLKKSFENSYATCIAYDGDKIIGKARALSDGVCNAYVVDVWTHNPYRHRGIASKMMESLFEQLPGQHIYLFTDSGTLEFYDQLGFKRQGIGVSKVIGKWLDSNPS
jgi:predicted GNAT family acetyltransferase